MNIGFKGSKCRDLFPKFVAVLLTIATIALMTGAVSVGDRKKITISFVNEFEGKASSKSYITKKATIEEFLAENKITLADDEVLDRPLSDKTENNQKITIYKAVPVTINIAGDIKTDFAVKKTVGETLDFLGITRDILDRVEPSENTEISENMIIKVFRFAVSRVETHEALPYERIEIPDATLAQGVTAVKTAGVDGIKKTVVNVVTENGVEIKRDFVSEETVKEPVNEVVLVGTKTAGTKAVAGGTINYSKKITVTATAYTATGNRTASGRPAQVGVIAVDPKVIPLGTKLYVESVDEGGSWSYGYCIAGDTGGAIKGNKIDLYYNSRGECIQFGRRSATVYVLD